MISPFHNVSSIFCSRVDKLSICGEIITIAVRRTLSGNKALPRQALIEEGENSRLLDFLIMNFPYYSRFSSQIFLVFPDHFTSKNKSTVELQMTVDKRTDNNRMMIYMSLTNQFSYIQNIGKLIG